MIKHLHILKGCIIFVSRKTNNLKDNIMKTNLTASELIEMGVTPITTGHSDELIKEYTNIFGQFCSVEVRFNLYYEDGQPQLDRQYVYVNYSGFLMLPHKGYNEKSYRFYLPYSSLDNAANYKNETEQPNRIGAPTAKKLDEWANYLKNELAEKNALLEKNTNKINDFLKSLEPFAASIRWDKDNTSGYIIKNGIEFSFSIDKREGYICKKIEIHYSCENAIETFIKLSNNDYVAKSAN